MRKEYPIENLTILGAGPLEMDSSRGFIYYPIRVCTSQEAAARRAIHRLKTSRELPRTRRSRRLRPRRSRRRAAGPE